MQYLTADGHGLPHDPFKAIVSPRPIGWISSVDAAGRVNLAPYSFFNAIADNPPMVMFASTGRKIGIDEAKDSVTNIAATREFVVNIVSYALRDAMNLSSGGYPAGEDEFELAGLTKAASIAVAPPRVAEAPAALECVLHEIIELPTGTGGIINRMVLGRVVAVHIRDELLADGLLDITRYVPLTRCGYKDYASATEVFQMTRPKGGDREI
ncbi:MAG: flavin reductase (DIM6/NTAB) family NADH-FMN oxidoreductase RutF [Paracoccaceae bacterium]|jgi:flavin reductase (DIM6/NTAB) family NADH-FMN oxidoreductase RutF